MIIDVVKIIGPFKILMMKTLGKNSNPNKKRSNDVEESMLPAPNNVRNGECASSLIQALLFLH